VGSRAGQDGCGRSRRPPPPTEIRSPDLVHPLALVKTLRTKGSIKSEEVLEAKLAVHFFKKGCAECSGLPNNYAVDSNLHVMESQVTDIPPPPPAGPLQVGHV
jgi:hypothetical protein